jgi:hypothetical protein
VIRELASGMRQLAGTLQLLLDALLRIALSWNRNVLVG